MRDSQTVSDHIGDSSSFDRGELRRWIMTQVNAQTRGDPRFACGAVDALGQLGKHFDVLTDTDVRIIDARYKELLRINRRLRRGTDTAPA